MTAIAASHTPDLPLWATRWIAQPMDLPSIRAMFAEVPPEQRDVAIRFPPGAVVQCTCGHQGCTRWAVVCGMGPCRNAGCSGVHLEFYSPVTGYRWSAASTSRRIDVVAYRDELTSDVMRELLGTGSTQGGVTMSRDEFAAVNRLYGFAPEAPRQKPAPPAEPERAAFPTKWEYDDAVKARRKALKDLDNWEDPTPHMQAGADRNAMRHAETDGLRLLAWIAKFVSPGEDPLKTVVAAAVAAGWDVDPADAEWAWSDDEVET